ncbi:MAG TPA: pilus assembly protein PilN [Raoultella sp.]|uniref:PilN domain-containing protein n=1 Tax=Raoultella terrigena TaxID=577 RepID=UPI000EEFE1CA|nr:pilus assembly protein PilN [Raoultella sp.]
MAQAINLLPWRAARRRQRLRLWLLSAGGLLLGLLLALSVSRASREADDRLKAVRAAAENQLYAALQQRQRLMQEQLQQHEKQRLRHQQRELTRAWQPRLRRIASLMPEQAWLTRLEYQQNTLTLSGLTLRLNALSALETALKTVDGFRPAKTGETRRDTGGRWLFSFSLAGESHYAGTY